MMMRWNVVIGGQEISKTGKGLLTYQMLIFGREGAITAAVLVFAPLAVLYGLVRLFPPVECWETPAADTDVVGVAPELASQPA